MEYEQESKLNQKKEDESELKNIKNEQKIEEMDFEKEKSDTDPSSNDECEDGNSDELDYEFREKHKKNIVIQIFILIGNRKTKIEKPGVIWL